MSNCTLSIIISIKTVIVNIKQHFFFYDHSKTSNKCDLLSKVRGRLWNFTGNKPDFVGIPPSILWCILVNTTVQDLSACFECFVPCIVCFSFPFSSVHITLKHIEATNYQHIRTTIKNVVPLVVKKRYVIFNFLSFCIHL